MASNDLSAGELERAAEMLRASAVEVELEERREARALAQGRPTRSALDGDGALSAAGRRAAQGPGVAPSHGSGARRGMRDRHRRRGSHDAVGPVDQDHGDGLRPHDVPREMLAGRRNELDAIAGSVVRAGERLGVPSPVLEARRRSRRAVTRSETPAAVAFVPARAGPSEFRRRTFVRSRGIRCSPTRSRPPSRAASSTESSSRPTPRTSPRSPVGTARKCRSYALRGTRPQSRPDIEWLTFTLGKLDESYDLRHRARATNPFRGPGAVRRGLEQLLATPEADSLRRRAREASGQDVVYRRGREDDVAAPRPVAPRRCLARAVPGVARGRTAARSRSRGPGSCRTSERARTHRCAVLDGGPRRVQRRRRGGLGARGAAARVRRRAGAGDRTRAVCSGVVNVASLGDALRDAGWRPGSSSGDDRRRARGLGRDHGLARVSPRSRGNRGGSRARRRRTRSAGRGAVHGISTGIRGRAPGP